MAALRTGIAVVWVVFWLYWLVSARTAKHGSRTARTRPPGLLIIAVFLLLRAFKLNGLTVEDAALEGVGAVLFLAGIGFAVWARVYLGRNWGMPMTRKDEPELVTTGPYRYVRHPIYAGILLALLGTAFASDLYFLIAVGVLAVYFVYSAKVEEGLMTSAFPTTYPDYRAKTKMLIPFVL